jgi:hypothetical protein
MAKVNQLYFLCLLLIFISARNSYAQSIYAGGSGDGFNVSSFAQPDNILFNIYAGGSNDGFSVSSFAQPDNVLFDIYKGGNNDGFAISSFAQADNVLFDIYKGGAEDGFSMSSFAQPDNVLYDIYKGGMEDGFSFSSFAQPDNVLYDIYKGGISDGFAFSVLGGIGTEVPLPIELVSFEGEFENGKVLLVWRTATELNNERFILERSINGIEFSALYVTEGAGTTSVSQEYFYTDQNPFSGINYYRLKQVDFNQAFTYSKIISVEATDQPGPPITVFPNPSYQSDVIQIMLKGVVKGTPAVVSITTSKGQTIQTFIATIDDFNQIIINQSISASISKGVYLISVKLSDRILNVKWVVK